MVSAADLDLIADVIARDVPEQLLMYVLGRHEVVADYEALAKQATGPLTEQRRVVARAVVAAYARVDGGVRALIGELDRLMLWSPTFVQAMSPFLAPPAAEIDARQAFHRRRDHFLKSKDLGRYLREVEPRICCICGRYDLLGETRSVSGTGFLVGPDLVLTAMHVVGDLVAAGRGDEVPRRFGVFFDHEEQPLIGSSDERRPRVRRVALAQDWLVASSPDLREDGTIRDPDATQLGALKSSLDFALIRLAEDVGNQAVSATGGSVRSWIELPARPAALAPKDRIIITQHPGGEPRVVDFGFFAEFDPSGTRMRYDTETQDGTSGAPCFNSDFKLVGIHNAAYRPGGLNQAIRLEAVADLIRPRLDGAPAAARSTRLWNLSSDPAQPRVIIGRTRFLDWMTLAAGPAIERTQRVYAATAVERGAGRTFSLEILRSSRLFGERVVVLCGDVERLPERAEDVIRVLADRLQIPAAAMTGMPPRPASDLPSGAGDKQRRWASTVLPRWFADLVEQQWRQGLDWSLAWIVLDRPPPAAGPVTPFRIEPEVADLLAGLIGVALDEASVPPALKRLRWLFLGTRPDFLLESDVTSELLDARAVTREDVAGILVSAYAARHRVPAPDEMDRFGTVVAVVLSAFDQNGLPPEKRLSMAQALFSAQLDAFVPRSATS